MNPTWWWPILISEEDWQLSRRTFRIRFNLNRCRDAGWVISGRGKDRWQRSVRLLLRSYMFVSCRFVRVRP